jgi:3-deoxy-D-arabino-heptulosonate 7-phosphate (DAHP) synthase class II
MLQAYTQAAASLNLLRAFSTGGFADMHRVHAWTLGFTEGDEAERYRDMANRISDTLDFMTAAGVTATPMTLHGGFLHQPRGAAAGIRRGAAGSIRPPANGSRARAT